MIVNPTIRPTEREALEAEARDALTRMREAQRWSNQIAADLAEADLNRALEHLAGLPAQ